jgi:ADP-ribose pyrophosphatase YjhB (NUDIX family)
MAKPSIELIARGVLRDGDRVLLCRNRKQGHLFLPGGHVEFGERASMALEREMREEMGVDLVAGRFLGATEGWFEQVNKRGDSVRHHEVNLVFELGWSTGVDSASGVDPVPGEIESREAKITFEWWGVADLTGVEPRVRLLPASMARLITEPSTQWAGDWR